MMRVAFLSYIVEPEVVLMYQDNRVLTRSQPLQTNLYLKLSKNFKNFRVDQIVLPHCLTLYSSAKEGTKDIAVYFCSGPKLWLLKGSIHLSPHHLQFGNNGYHQPSFWICYTWFPYLACNKHLKQLSQSYTMCSGSLASQKTSWVVGEHSAYHVFGRYLWRNLVS